MEQVSLPEFDVFTAPHNKIHRKYWQGADIWGITSSYPPSIRRGFETLKETVHHYIAHGYSDWIRCLSGFEERFLSKFCHLISETECVEMSFARAGGIIYEFGFEWCKLKILQYYRKFRKTPLTNNSFFYYIKRDSRKGVLKQYDILSWDDLIEVSLQDHTFFQRDRQNLTGYRGLQRAKTNLQKQYKKNGKIPLSNDPGCRLIANGVRRNFWADFGITTWGDLIFKVFGYVKGTVNLWAGSGGLDRAISWIKGYVIEHGTLPSAKSTHYPSIKNLISKKYWIEYGINTWDDLTFKACGMVKSKKKRKNWTGKEGFERAKNELKTYFNNHQKLPTTSVFPSLAHVASKGYWKEYDVNSWNDLLKDTFGRVNVVHETWRGQEGLNRAKKTLTKYKIEYQKYPKVNDHRVRGIRRALIGKYWVEFGISTWNDLLQQVFPNYPNHI